MRKFFVGFLGLLVLLTLFLLFLEGAFYFLKPQLDDKLFQKDPVLGWGFIPNKKGRVVFPKKHYQPVAINSDGFRDYEFNAQGKERKRIAVFGDSFAANLEVPADKVFTEIMEKGLNDVSVMNFGVSGYGQVQELLLFKQLIQRLHFDIAIFMIFTLNDFIDNTSSAFWGGTPAPYARWDSDQDKIEIIPPEAVKGAETRSFMDKSHFLTFLRARWSLLRLKISRYFESNQIVPFDQSTDGDTDMLEMLYFKKVLRPKIESDYKITCSLLLSISEECQRAKIPCLFIIAPARGQVDQSIFDDYVSSNRKDAGNYDYLKPNKILLQYAEAHKLVMMDLHPRLFEEQQKGLPLYDPEGEHWTELGNKIVAEELLKFLNHSGLLEEEPASAG